MKESERMWGESSGDKMFSEGVMRKGKKMCYECR